MAGPRLHSRLMAQWAPTPSPASRPGLTGRQGHPGCCENTLVGRREPQRLGFLTSLSTTGKPASLSVGLCLSAVGDRPTSSCQDVGWPCQALLLSFPFLSLLPPVRGALWTQPCGEKRERLGLLSLEPPSRPPSLNGTCGLALAQGHAFFHTQDSCVSISFLGLREHSSSFQQGNTKQMES